MVTVIVQNKDGSYTKTVDGKSYYVGTNDARYGRIGGEYATQQGYGNGAGGVDTSGSVYGNNGTVISGTGPSGGSGYSSGSSVGSGSGYANNRTGSGMGTSYSSPYSKQISDTLAALSSRSFNYDPSSDTGLQAAQDDAMDAVSTAAARRNMLYSDSNKSQMGKSALSLIPQYEQLAFNRYSQEGNDMYNTLSALGNLESQSYNQYSDTRNYGYQQQRDAALDQQWQKTYEESIRQYNMSQAQAQAIADQEYALNKQQMDQNYSLSQQKASSSSSGSGGNSEIAKPTLTAAQTLAAIKAGTKTNAVLSAYEYYYGEPYSDTNNFTDNADYDKNYTELRSHLVSINPTTALTELLNKRSSTISNIGVDYYNSLVAELKKLSAAANASTKYEGRY